MQIICIKNHKIEKLKHLNNDKYELLKFLNLNKIESFEMLSSYEKGSITISKLYEYVINLRAKLHKYEDDIMDTKIKEFIKKLDELLDYFMMNNLKSEFSAIYLKKYIVMLMLYDVKIREIILQI